ncbi:hypothetical protein J2W57_002377 [Chryseobacterium ginsenosidimutans]|uniref:Uncharacterized protein n=1 Tax=Chryseobacterium geocarposphaerae TaxID=1416776 RepID=A0ABU1LGI8_9FLAO|nr:hypothetical protein [Chryseobacterium geocarposphaerae]MDR6699000.1 hypothetical protein [Chryseobacterium ginsenosidimutans]
MNFNRNRIYFLKFIFIKKIDFSNSFNNKKNPQSYLRILNILNIYQLFLDELRREYIFSFIFN